MYLRYVLSFHVTCFSFFTRGQKSLKAATDVHAEGKTASRQSYTGMQSLEKAIEELDRPVHMPDGLDEHVWNRLIQARRVKVESEQKVGLSSFLFH